MRFTRVASVVAGGVLVLGAGVVVAAVAFGDRLLAAAIEGVGPAVLGREVRVGGVAIDWGRHATVAATGLSVADAGWTGNPAMLSVGRAEVTIDLLDLLRFRLSPVRLSLRDPVLRLARDDQGRWNVLAVGDGAGGTGNPAPGKLAALREIEVENGEVTMDLLASPGVEGRVSGLSARMPRAAGDGGIGFGGVAGWGAGRPIAFSGRAGSPAELFRAGGGGEPFPVRLAIGPDTARVSAAGHVARPLDLAGFDLRVEGRGDDLAPLLAALGAAPAAPTPPFEVGARVTDAERGWALDDIAARLGESRARGKAAVSLKGRDRPLVSMDLVSPRLALSDFGWLVPAGGRGDAPANSLADAAFPTAWLRPADAEGKLRVERLEGVAAEPAELRLGFELKGGRLGLEPVRLDLARGAAEGTASVDAGDDGAAPRLALAMEARGVRLRPLLGAFGVGQVAGELRTASVDLRGRGATLRQVAAALDGAARFRIADGSLDVPGLSNLSMGLFETFGHVVGGGGGRGGAPTPIACAFGDLAVRRGVVQAERLTIVTPRVAISGEGTVALRDGAMRLTFVPKPLDEAFLRVVVPVVVKGDLASPQVETHPELRAGLRPESAADVCREESSVR